ncbi:MAG: PAS domain S-box protein [Patescibacteria group bacterium]
MNDKQNTLSFSAERFLDAVSDCAFVLDYKFNCLYINEGALRALDLGKKGMSEVLGKNLLKLKPRFASSLLYKKCLEAKSENMPIVFDEYVSHIERWFKCRIYPSGDMLLILMRDNTDELAIFSQIKESEEYHRTLIENVKDYAIFVLDIKGKIRTWNKGAERLLGYSAEEVLGKTPFIFYSKDGRKVGMDMRQLQQVKLEGKFEQEGWWVRKDGTQFWANEILSYFKDESGGMKGYTKVVRDMTERKNTEEMLKRYTRDLERSTRAIETEVAKDEALLDSIGEGVIATDETGRIVVFNQQAQSLLGWSQEDAIGEFYHNVWKIEGEDGEVISNTKRPVAMSLNNGKKIVNSAYYYSSAYRKPFPVSMTSAPVVLEGETIGAVMVFRDISKEKEVDRAKSEFVSLASHQLRTPLTAIKLFVEMLLLSGASNLTKEQQEMLQSVNESNEKMIKLVENLLDVSRLETGVLTVKLEQVVLKEFIIEVVHELQPVANSHKCNLVLSLPSTAGTKVTTDPVLLRQVLNNLINNAIAYSPDRRCNIYIDVAVNPGFQYQITVQDEGIGIPKEALPNIFQRFYRADNAVKARTEGNGLGLYMSKMMTETLGGKITCVSKLNIGTTFTVTFPLSKPRHPAVKRRVRL